MKTWEVKFEVNMDASHIEKFTVKANTERKAIIFAKAKAFNRGFRYVKLISAKDITPVPSADDISAKNAVETTQKECITLQNEFKTARSAVNSSQKKDAP